MMRKPGSFAELKVGDQLRALGTKSADGSRFTPEEIVTGSFQTISGTITEIDAEKKEIKIKDLQSQQPVTIAISKDSSMRRLTPEMIAALATCAGERKWRLAGDVRSTAGVHAARVESRVSRSSFRARRVQIRRASRRLRL